MTVLILTSGQVWAATGGSLLVTSSADTVAVGATVDVTVAVSAADAGATAISSAGIVVEWDKSVFALDASSALGTAGDNDPHKTPYLDGQFGQKQNDQNNRITQLWKTTGDTDVMELRISDQDVSGDSMFGTANRAYINYTRTASFNQSGAVISNYQFFTLKLLVKSGATAGNSAVKAKFIAVSDNKGSTPASYTQGTKTLAVSAPSMSVTAGNNQSAVAGSAVGTALGVTLATGTTPNAGVTVTFTAAGGATFATGPTATAVSDANGIATAPALTLGTTVGAYTVTASATGYTSQTFTLTGTAGAAASIVSSAGTDQTAMVGTALAAPFTVTVKDANNNVVSNATVNFAVATGGGSVNPATATTNAQGQASTTLTLGTIVGANSVTASVTGAATPATFNATGTAGTASQLVLGAAATTVSATVANQVVLTGTLKDQYGNTVISPAKSVTFTTNATTYGSIGTATVTTVNGVATTTLTTIAQPAGGSSSLNIVVDASTDTIAATSVADLTVSLVFNAMSQTSGNSQTATVGTAVTNPLSVTLTTGTTPSAGVEVTFTTSGGTFANGTTTTKATTNAQGVATSSALTLGTTAGTYTVTVTATGYSSQTFTLTATAGAAASVTKSAGDAQSGTVGSALTTPFTVVVKDANNNVVSNATVTFAVASGGGSVSAATGTTDANGLASTTLTLGTTAGANSVTAAVTGVTTPATFTATGTAGTASQLSLGLSSTKVSSYSSSQVTLTGTLKDQYGNTATAATSDVTFVLDAATYGYLGTSGTLTKTVTPVNGVATTTVTTVLMPLTDTATHNILIDASTGTITKSMVTDVTLALVPFSVNVSAVNLVAGDTTNLTVTGGSAATAWTKTSTTAGTLSGTTGTAVTYTAGSVAASTTDTVTASDSIGGTPVTSAVNVTVYTPVGTSWTTATAAVLGQTMTLIINGGNGNYTCTSSAPAVATVTATATSSTCTVTTVATGSFTIMVQDTATYQGTSKTTNSSTTAAVEVVHPITVTSAKNTDGKVYLDTSTNKSYTITATGGKTTSYTYSSSNTAAATVSSDGVVTAQAAGTTEITLTSTAYTNITQKLVVVVMGPIAIKDTATTPSEITTSQIATSGGSGLTFTLTGGSTNYAVAATGPGSYSATLTATNGVYTFNPPTTGAFAGVYTVTVTDTTAGLTKTMTVNVPYKVTASKSTILGTDTTQLITVTGGAAGDIFKLTMLDGAGTADANGAIAGLSSTASSSTGSATLTATAVTGTGTNPAMGYIVPKSTLTAVTLFKVKAVLQTNNADSTNSWATVTSNAVSILPVTTYALTVSDSSGTAMSGAVVTLRSKSEVETTMGSAITISATDANGKTSVSLPVGGTYTFNVVPANLTTHQTGSITLASGTTSGTVTLRKIGTPMKYTGTLVNSASLAATVTAVDASGNKVEGSIVGTTFTVWVDTSVFTPVNLYVSATGGLAVKKAVSEATTSCVNSSDVAQTTLTTQATCIAVTGNVWKGTFSTLTLAAAPTSLSTASTAIQTAVTTQVTHTTPSALQASDIVTAAVQPISVGTTDATSIDLSSKLTTVGAVKVTVPLDAFSATDVGQVYVTARGAKLSSTNASTTTAYNRAAITGGEVVEIDLVAFDSNGTQLSTSSGNTTINSSVGIPVSIPVNLSTLLTKVGLTTMDVTTINSRIVVYTAPTLQDFLDNKNVTTISGATFDSSTNTVKVNMPHFSVVVPSVSETTTAATKSGGGGCFIATAAYGSYEAPYVKLLREFRDEYLLTNEAGSWFVEQYYAHSPAAADWLREHDTWKAVVRVLLLPLIGMSWLLLHGTMSMTMALLALLIAVPFGIRGWRRARLAKAC
ncbi:MAG: Ig-like domain-containing protein [Magnetococcales bacterium]|nr:Ig-like domain-containing protein [Magnetococcales bacterium]